MIAWNIGKIMNNYSNISVLNVMSYILISLGKTYENKFSIYIAIILLLIALYLFVKIAHIKKEKPKNKSSLFIQPILLICLLIYAFLVIGF